MELANAVDQREIYFLLLGFINSQASSKCNLRSLVD